MRVPVKTGNGSINYLKAQKWTGGRMTQHIHTADGSRITVMGERFLTGTFRVVVSVNGKFHQEVNVRAYDLAAAEDVVVSLVQLGVERGLAAAGRKSSVSFINGELLKVENVPTGKNSNVDTLYLYRKDRTNTVRVVSGESGSEYTVERKNNVLTCTCTSFGIRGYCRHSGAVTKLVADGKWSI